MATSLYSPTRAGAQPATTIATIEHARLNLAVVNVTQAVIQHVAASGMDLGDVLYVSPTRPVTVLDVIYGLGKEIETSGQGFYAHKNGFTPKLLQSILERAGFADVRVFVMPQIYEARALAFKTAPAAAPPESSRKPVP